MGESAQERCHDHVAEHHDVSREAHQDVPQSLATVIAKGQSLEMVEELAPERKNHVLPRGRGPDVLGVIELPPQGGEHENRGDRAHQQRDGVSVDPLQRMAEEMDLPPEKDAVEEKLDGPGLERRDDRISDRGQRGEEEPRDMGLEVGPKARYRGQEPARIVRRFSKRVERARGERPHGATSIRDRSTARWARSTAPSSAEVAAHVSRRRSSKRVIREHAQERIRERGRVARRHDEARLEIDHSLLDSRDRRGHDGHSRRHRLEDHGRYSVLVAVRRHDRGLREHMAPWVELAGEPVLRDGAEDPGRRLETPFFDHRGEPAALRSFSGDEAAETVAFRP